MKLAERDTNPGAFAVTVSCIRCGRRRQLSDIRADLDGPPFYAYFCVETCIPHDTTDAAFVYQDKGWQKVAGEWRKT